MVATRRRISCKPLIPHETTLETDGPQSTTDRLGVSLFPRRQDYLGLDQAHADDDVGNGYP